MLTRTTRLNINRGLFLCLLLSLTACGSDDADKKQGAEKSRADLIEEAVSADQMQNASRIEVIDENGQSQFIDPELAKTNSTKSEDEDSSDEAEEISWNHLIPDEYDPEAIIGKYMKQIENLQDGDKEAMEIYGKIQAELDNAPVNTSMDGKSVKIPGFIAPLENDNGIVKEFLLVPYFGACIHTPPPPMNQTVFIKADKGQGVKSEDAYNPVWITGELKAIEERTDIGAAGYRIENAVVEPYEEDE